MTPEELNEWLALHVMGWQLLPESILSHAQYFDPKKYDSELASDEQGYEVLVKDWSPTTNISQSMECLDRFHGDYRINIFDFKVTETGQIKWRVEIDPEESMKYSAHESLPMAISLAVARVAGAEV